MPSARRLIDGVGSIPHREPAVAVGAVASALREGRVSLIREVLRHRLRIVRCHVDGEMVQSALRGIDLRPRRVGGEALVGRDGGRVIGPLLGSHEAALPLVRAVAPDGAATLRAIGGPTDILVETLTSAGFKVAVEQVSMSFGGHALPGKRELYLALMHPTLG